jgi:hypothetical protein
LTRLRQGFGELGVESGTERGGHDNLKMMNCDLQWALDLTAESKRTAQRAVPIIGRNANGSVQAYDFSPVRTVLGVFHPISQPEGSDFSPVTKICPEKFSAKVCSQ